MAKDQKEKHMSAIEDRLLTAAQVRVRCNESDVAQIAGETPVDMKLFMGIGQERFEHALALCVETEDPLHNMNAVDLGAGGFAIVEGLLKKMLSGRTMPDPEDVCYVHNFEDPHRPQLIMFPKGKGRKFQKRLARLLAELKKVVPHELSGAYAEEKKRVVREPYETWIRQAEEHVRQLARRFGFTTDGELSRLTCNPLISLIHEAKGETLAATEADRPAENQDIVQLNLTQQGFIKRKSEEFRNALEEWFRDENVIQEHRRRTREVMNLLEATVRNIAKEAIEQVFEVWWPLESGGPTRFRKNLSEYSVSAYSIFLQEEKEHRQGMSPWEAPAENPFLPWEVKVFVDHSETVGIPIVAGRITTLASAIGSIGRGRSYGPNSFVVDHRNLSPGFFHVANGGYLILSARDVVSVPYLWQVIKSVIKNQEIPAGENPLMAGYDSLHPEPITARLKIILFGPAWLMHLFSVSDEEFTQLFKIRGEVLTKVERTPDQLHAYRSWLEGFVKEEGMHSLGKDATCALVEHSQRLAGDNLHLSTDLDALATLVREANALIDERAPEEEKKIRRSHITEAVRKRVWRSNVPHERRLEHIKSGNLIISTSGKAIGQVNGLVVSSYDSVEKQIDAFCRSAPAPFNVPADVAAELKSEYGGMFGLQASLAFGSATRITAVSSVGKFEPINILKEVKQAGPSFEKADLIVQGLLRKYYGQEAPLYAHLMFSFEQTYGGVDGDSASLIQYLLLTSAIGKIPLRQDIAVTGSVNLHGEIQPIGGANEKTEGWLDICRAQGELSGTQGVCIPHQNVQNLMLREDVVEAIRAGKYNVWAPQKLSELIEIMAEMPAEEYRAGVQKGFDELAEKTKRFIASTKSE